MLYLRTGGNGSGKTLFTLQDVRKLQLETGRPVCHNGRFKIKPEKEAEFGWKKIDFKDWQDQDDGTIFLIDECHYDLPQRPPSQFPPPHIAKLTEHRARGFDFFLLTQHPGNIDKFVRNLVQPPGWHEHVKRLAGAAPVSNFCRWDAVELQCEKMGSGRTGEVKTRAFPKEVYDWYDSAFLHTGKVRVPSRVWVVLACMLAVPTLLYLGFSSAFRNVAGDEVEPAKVVKDGLAGATGAPGSSSSPTRVKTTAEFIAAHQPRIEGLRHTAPAYDKLTEPKRVPVPAACMSMGDKCRCYTQDATVYQTSADICRQIVQNGLWLDFNPEGSRGFDQNAARPVQPNGAVAAPSGEAPAPTASLAVFADPGRSTGRPDARVATSAVGQQPESARPRVPSSSPWSFRSGS